MIIQTERLHIYPASNEEMQSLIASQTVPELKAAYREMLDGCQRHPDQREWYALWDMERNDGSKAVITGVAGAYSNDFHIN